MASHPGSASYCAALGHRLGNRDDDPFGPPDVLCRTSAPPGAPPAKTPPGILASSFEVTLLAARTRAMVDGLPPCSHRPQAQRIPRDDSGGSKCYHGGSICAKRSASGSLLSPTGNGRSVAADATAASIAPTANTADAVAAGSAAVAAMLGSFRAAQAVHDEDHWSLGRVPRGPPPSSAVAAASAEATVTVQTDRDRAAAQGASPYDTGHAAAAAAILDAAAAPSGRFTATDPVASSIASSATGADAAEGPSWHLAHRSTACCRNVQLLDLLGLPRDRRSLRLHVPYDAVPQLYDDTDAEGSYDRTGSYAVGGCAHSSLVAMQLVEAYPARAASGLALGLAPGEGYCSARQVAAAQAHIIPIAAAAAGAASDAAALQAAKGPEVWWSLGARCTLSHGSLGCGTERDFSGPLDDIAVEVVRLDHDFPGPRVAPLPYSVEWLCESFTWGGGDNVGASADHVNSEAVAAAAAADALDYLYEYDMYGLMYGRCAVACSGADNTVCGGYPQVNVAAACAQTAPGLSGGCGCPRCLPQMSVEGAAGGITRCSQCSRSPVRPTQIPSFTTEAAF